MKRFFKLTVLFAFILFIASLLLDVIFTKILSQSSERNKVEYVIHSFGKKYDVIIIDLFEPCEENKEEWKTLIKSLHNWVTVNGSIVMYAGMRNITEKIQPYEKLIETIEFMESSPGHLIRDLCLCKDIIPYRVWIPSFSGESTFLLVTNIIAEQKVTVNSHLTHSVWESYKVFN